jgi:hypothetical protein
LEEWGLIFKALMLGPLVVERRWRCVDLSTITALVEEGFVGACELGHAALHRATTQRVNECKIVLYFARSVSPSYSPLLVQRFLSFA